MLMSNDKRVLQVLDLLEQSRVFKAGEIAALQEYLAENGDRRILEEIGYRDLTVVSEDIQKNVRALLVEIDGKGKHEMAGRLGNFLFAAGGLSSRGLIDYKLLTAPGCRVLAEEPDKLLALFSMECLFERAQAAFGFLHKGMAALARMAGDNPENARKATEYLTDLPERQILLMALYFQLKYPQVSQTSPGEGSGSVAPEDATFLRQYEDMLEAHLDDALPNGVEQVDYFWLGLLGGAGFANYELSPRLKKVAAVCFATDTEKIMNAVWEMDLRGNLKKYGGCMDEIFGADSLQLIRWALKYWEREILAGQLKCNRQVFLSCVDTDADKMNIDHYRMIMEIVRENAPDLYKERHAKDALRQQEKVTAAIIRCLDHYYWDTAKEYLAGGVGPDKLFEINEDREPYHKYAGGPGDEIQSYREVFGSDAFVSRCESLLMVYGAFGGYNCYKYVAEDDRVSARRVKELFGNVDRCGIPLHIQLKGYEDFITEMKHDLRMTKYPPAVHDREERVDTFIKASKEVFLEYLAGRREELIAFIRAAGVEGRCLGVMLFGEAPEQNQKLLLEFLEDREKPVRDGVIGVMCKSRFWEPEALACLNSKKAAQREVGIRILTEWKDGKYLPELKAALAREKSARIEALLEDAIRATGSEALQATESKTCEIDKGYLVEKLHKGNKKRSLEWAYEEPFSKVHRKGGEEADVRYLQAILLGYSAAGGESPEAVILAKDLEEKELAVYMGELFERWMEKGAEAKKRWVLYAAVIHGDAGIVDILLSQIKEWPRAGRSKLAAEAVRALTYSPNLETLLLVDELSRKAKHEPVRTAAMRGLNDTEIRLGTTLEALMEQTVPDFGFDENMRRVFDYGTRKFTVTITVSLELQVIDEKGKKLKNLPVPGKRDEEAMASAVYEEFKKWKKQIKTVVTAQKKRLERVLLTGRRWELGTWMKVFVRNPVMHQFAIGLVWGLYEEGRPVAGFRYMEDGSFCTPKGEEIVLTAGKDRLTCLTRSAAIDRESSWEQCSKAGRLIEREQHIGQCAGQGQHVGLMHPTELSAAMLEEWRAHFEDYEITQPMEQIARPVFCKAEEERGQRVLERFGGCIINDLALGRKLMNQGWVRGPVEDGGRVYTYYREDREIRMGAVLNFSGSFLGIENEDVTVEEVKFYHLDKSAEEKGGKETEPSFCEIIDVPDRYFSEVLYQITNALAISQQKDDNWKKR